MNQQRYNTFGGVPGLTLTAQRSPVGRILPNCRGQLLVLIMENYTREKGGFSLEERQDAAREYMRRLEFSSPLARGGIPSTPKEWDMAKVEKGSHWHEIHACMIAIEWKGDACAHARAKREAERTSDEAVASFMGWR